MAENKGFSLKTFGMPWWLAGAIAVIVIAAAATGALSADLAGCFALMLAIGLICNEIGERIPFWNSYIGGGLVLTFLVSAFLFTYKLIEYTAAVCPEWRAMSCRWRQMSVQGCLLFTW